MEKIEEVAGAFLWSVWGVVFSGFMLFVPASAWDVWLHGRYGPEWRPAERERFYSISGELQVRYGNYVVIGPKRPVILKCYRLGSGGPNIIQSCLPDNIQNYVGRQINVLLARPLVDQYKVTFYEITSGDDVLFSYDRIRKSLILRYEIRRAERPLGPAFLTMCCISPLVIAWVGYARARKRPRLSGQPDSGHAGAADK